MLCLGFSRCVFLVAEIGPWYAEDVVKGAFRHPATFGVSYPCIHPMLRFGL